MNFLFSTTFPYVFLLLLGYLLVLCSGCVVMFYFSCCKYVCMFIDIDYACTTLADILLKAHVLNVSDKEKSLGCLRRQDKLSN